VLVAELTAIYAWTACYHNCDKYTAESY